MAEARVQRRLAAILAADVVGYSRLMGTDEVGTLAQLKTLRKEVFDPMTAEYGGRIVNTAGDGILIEFPSAVDAVSHALDVQRALAQRNATVPEDRRMELRIGINVGDVMIDGDDIHGDGVNVAARLEGLCRAGEVYVSAAVHDQVEGKITAAFDDLGEHEVKNIAKPIRVYRVSAGQMADPVAARADKLFERPAVAVLPFENIGGDPEQEYFADGLSEDIITALSLWRSFPVIARHSTFAYKGTSPDIRTVGRELGARYVIEGSVRKSGEQIRVTAQLIDTRTGHHVWADRYDRRLSDIFALQDELTRNISAIVVPELELAEGKRLKAATPRNLDAWDYVLRGRSRLNEFSLNGNDQAREHFKRAVELDAEYSYAYSGLARCGFSDLALGNDREAVADVISQSFVYARSAVDLDESDSLAHEMLGLALMFSREFDAAVMETKKAIELNPSNARAFANLGYQLAVDGWPEEGVAAAQRGLALNPKDPRNVHYQSMLALAQLTARQYQDAANSAMQAVQRRSDIAEPHLMLAASLAHLGKLSEARASLAECERVQPGYVEWALEWMAFKHADDREHLLDGLRKAGWQG